ncbi:MAG: ABC-F family ATP-binding cassette domain-containing protein [Eubacteriales bacterium]|nr:ABC-F family ATP-binding cassette domain-containing protein [Eubacteriales bacterium]
MSVLTLSHLAKSYANQEVLKDINLSLDRGDRLGLIGHNGSGKTTLLRLIAGKEEPDAQQGRLQLAEQVICKYLEQEFTQDDLDRDALEHPEFRALQEELEQIEAALALNPTRPELLARYAEINANFAAKGTWDYPYRLAQAAAGLGLNLEKVKRKRSQLSGGERMRLALASILVEDADLLLLDEPTNHLDLEAIEWLSNYLAQSKAALIVVSHDRAFLDTVTNLTAELNNGKLTVYRGNYSRFKEIQSQDRLRLARESSKLQKAIDHEAEVIQTLYSHRKISSYHSRQKKLSKLQEALTRIKEETKVVNPRFKLSYLQEADPGRAGQLLIAGRGVSVRFPDASVDLFQPVDIDIQANQRILICGPNGCGKTNLLKCLAGQNPYLVGDIRILSNLRFASLDQWQRFEDQEQELLPCLMAANDRLTAGQAQETLASYGFFQTDLHKRLKDLSGGEKSRLALACILQQKPDLLFLDEPTNHLDIRSAEILESALQDFKGTIVAVSHDRYFIQTLAQQVWGFLGREIKTFYSYPSYRQAVQAWQSQQAPPGKKGAASTHKTESPATDKGAENFFSPAELKLWPELKNLPWTGKSKQAERQIRAQGANALKAMEEEISTLEASTADLEALFGKDDSQELYEKYGQEQIRLEALLDLYVKLDELLASFRPN